MPVDPTATPVTEKATEVAPCGIVTLWGADAIEVSATVRVTTIPPAGAASVFVTVTGTLLPTPGAMVPVLKDRLPRCNTVTGSVPLVHRVALAVTVADPGATPFTGNGAELVAPAGMNTDD